MICRVMNIYVGVTHDVAKHSHKYALMLISHRYKKMFTCNLQYCYLPSTSSKAMLAVASSNALSGIMMEKLLETCSLTDEVVTTSLT